MHSVMTPQVIADLKDRLSYSPTDGGIYWRTNGPHHKPGDLAGSVYRDGHVWISLSGIKYPARYIAWVLLHGEAPTDPVHLVSDSLDIPIEQKRDLRQDFRPHNLISHPPIRSRKPRAIAARNRRAQLEAYRSGATFSAIDPDRLTDPTRPGLLWSASTGLWVVRDDPELLQFLPATQRPYVLRELARFKTLEEARAFYSSLTRRIHYLVSNPPPNLPPDIRAIQAAGDKYFGMTLQEAHHTFAYDPATGDLIWRAPPAYVGLPAGKPGATVPALYVSLHGRRYPVHSLAWFLTYAVWPGRKAIGWRNGDQTDNRLSNLYLTQREETP